MPITTFNSTIIYKELINPSNEKILSMKADGWTVVTIEYNNLGIKYYLRK